VPHALAHDSVEDAHGRERPTGAESEPEIDADAEGEPDVQGLGDGSTAAHGGVYFHT